MSRRVGTAAVRVNDCRAGVRHQHEHWLGRDSELERTTPASGACPTGVLDPGPHAIEGVLRELRARIPHIFTVSAYGHLERLTPRTTDIQDVRELINDDADLPGVRTFTGASSYWGRLGRRRCPKTARRSWMALMYFPAAQAVPFAYRYAFLARTKAGWTVWDYTKDG